MTANDSDSEESTDSTPGEAEREPGVRLAPRGIRVYCLFVGIGSFISILLGISVVADSELPTSNGLLAIAQGIVNFVLIYGLLRLRKWGWLLALGWFGITWMRSVVSDEPFGMILGLVLLFYLLVVKDVYFDEEMTANA